MSCSVSEGDRTPADRWIDSRWPLDEPRRIAGRGDPEVAHGSIPSGGFASCGPRIRPRLVRTRFKCRQELLMDVVEPAIGHDDNQITGSRLFADGADNLRDVRDV